MVQRTGMSQLALGQGVLSLLPLHPAFQIGWLAPCIPIWHRPPTCHGLGRGLSFSVQWSMAARGSQKTVKCFQAIPRGISPRQWYNCIRRLGRLGGSRSHLFGSLGVWYSSQQLLVVHKEVGFPFGWQWLALLWGPVLLRPYAIHWKWMDNPFLSEGVRILKCYISESNAGRNHIDSKQLLWHFCPWGLTRGSWCISTSVVSHWKAFSVQRSHSDWE